MGKDTITLKGRAPTFNIKYNDYKKRRELRKQQELTDKMYKRWKYLSIHH